MRLGQLLGKLGFFSLCRLKTLVDLGKFLFRVVASRSILLSLGKLGAQGRSLGLNRVELLIDLSQLGVGFGASRRFLLRFGELRGQTLVLGGCGFSIPGKRFHFLLRLCEFTREIRPCGERDDFSGEHFALFLCHFTICLGVLQSIPEFCDLLVRGFIGTGGSFGFLEFLLGLAKLGHEIGLGRFRALQLRIGSGGGGLGLLQLSL